MFETKSEKKSRAKMDKEQLKSKDKFDKETELLKRIKRDAKKRIGPKNTSKAEKAVLKKKTAAEKIKAKRLKEKKAIAKKAFEDFLKWL